MSKVFRIGSKLHLCKRPELKRSSSFNARRTPEDLVGRGIGWKRRPALKQAVRRVKVTLSRNAFIKLRMPNAFVGDQACVCFYPVRLPLSPDRAGGWPGSLHLAISAGNAPYCNLNPSYK